MPELPNVEYETVSISNLIPADYNPRSITPEALDGLKQSIQDHGLVQAIVANRRTGNIIGGHQRVVAMKELGVREVTVAWVDVEEEREKVLNLTLNNRLIEGDWDLDKLRLVLEELQETMPEALDLYRLADMGIDLGILNDVAGGVPGGHTDPDDVPEIDESVPPISKLGDLYQLGEHLLLCGDALVTSHVDRLMGGEHAQMICSDPPWNVSYGTGPVAELLGSKDRKIMGDSQDTDDWLKWVVDMAYQLGRITVAGGHIYLFMGAKSWPETHVALVNAKFIASSVIVWLKNSFVLGAGDYHSKWEPIWYGWKAGAARRCPLEDRTQDNVWEFDRPRVSDLHPHTKPVALLEKAILNSSRKGDVVIDLFGGSGSTMIACINTERICRMMDLDPHYCDVIVQRYTDYTGREAVRINADGTTSTWSELKSAEGGVDPLPVETVETVGD